MCGARGTGFIISIHALREEGDPLESSTLISVERFLSTPSARRATDFFIGVFTGDWISIHALREEGDHRRERRKPDGDYFYPRPPRGGRQ